MQLFAVSDLVLFICCLFNLLFFTLTTDYAVIGEEAFEQKLWIHKNIIERYLKL